MLVSDAFMYSTNSSSLTFLRLRWFRFLSSSSTRFRDFSPRIDNIENKRRINGRETDGRVAEDGFADLRYLRTYTVSISLIISRNYFP
jgi:hypothetical protein